MKTILLILTLGGVINISYADKTNKFYVTDDGFPNINRAQKYEAAKKSRESLSSEIFIEGNWGAPTNGFQLSLQFDKTKYSIGEAIRSTMLLRNVSNSLIKYNVATVAGIDGPIEFDVYGSEGKLSPQTLSVQNVVSSRKVMLLPEYQHKYIERLDKQYKLKKGASYTVIARFRTGCPACFDVKSAGVKITIAD